MLQIQNLTIRSKERTLINHVSLEIYEGEWFALVGQSGSGKSLLSQSIGHILPSNMTVEGEVRMEGKNVLDQIRFIRGEKIAYIFQDYQSSFTPFMKIQQHFIELFKAHCSYSKKEQKAKTVEALYSVGLDESFMQRYPCQLSGGQLQRVAIALALSLSPKLVIADEITTALDSVSGHRILELLAKKQKELGCTMLFITHDWRHIRRYADRLAVMKNGRIVELGEKKTILKEPAHPYTKQLIQASPSLEDLRLSYSKEAIPYELVSS